MASYYKLLVTVEKLDDPHVFCMGRKTIVTDDEFPGTEEGRRMALKAWHSVVGCYSSMEERPWYSVNAMVFDTEHKTIANYVADHSDSEGLVYSVLPDGYIEAMDGCEANLELFERWAEEKGAVYKRIPYDEVSDKFCRARED